MKPTIEYLRENNLIMFEYISGSQLYGTSIETSDIDIKGIFILPDDKFSDFDFDETWMESESEKFIIDEKSKHLLDDKFLTNFEKFKGKECEIKFYELKKFLKLLEKSNANMLEVFSIPTDCLIYSHPLMDSIILNQNKFLSKGIYKSFTGYALEQIAKAQGQNKKQNWKAERFERKTILDFCYCARRQGSEPFKDFIARLFPGTTQADFGLVKIQHMPFTYGLYKGDYKGLTNEDESSTELRVSNVGKEALPLTTMAFNENAWRIHCDEYKSYQTWLTEKNDARWVEVKNHGQQIDGKNILHMQRLINTAIDIVNGLGVISRRPEAQELIKIRRGEYPLKELLDSEQEKLKTLKNSFDNNTQLLNEVDASFCKQLNNNIRKFYDFKK